MQNLDGVLFFPVTPFDAVGAVDTAVLAKHVDAGVAAGPGGVFSACGTGEFHALEPGEYADVVRTTVEVTAGRVPVFAGTGGPLPLARQFARAARDAGADGLLLLPPYLVRTPAAGLVAYVEAVAAVTDLPLVVYHRDNARFDPASAAAVARLPQVTGLKDGIGDLDLLSRVVSAVRGRWTGNRSSSSTGCRRRRPLSRRTAVSESSCTPRRSSASCRRSPWPSTRPYARGTTASSTRC